MSDNADKADAFLFYLRAGAPDLPQPDKREFYFAKPERDWHSDFMYAGADGYGPGLIVEIDGGQHMVRQDKKGRYVVVGRHNLDDDKIKCNRLTSMGYLVLHVSPQMLENDPDAVMTDVRAALARIGRMA